MVSMMQMQTCMALEDEGLKQVGLPHTDQTPIPGLILFADEGHKRLEIVLGDGSVVDILKVYRLAEDCIRNWHKGGSLPQFVGDFKRLTPLADALNGRHPNGRS
jgi:hypothetical protein